MASHDPTSHNGTPASMMPGHNAMNANKHAPISPLEELMRRKGIDDAWSALEEMQKQGLESDRFTVSRMLMKTVADGRNRLNPARVYRGVSLVERFIQLQPAEADEVLFNALLDTCCRIKDINRLDSTFQRMKELQIPASHVTLGILVKAYGQAGDINRVLQAWEEMGEERRQANAVTFGCMIDACVKCGQMEKALEIFDDVKKKKKHRNTILYTTLIKGCGLEKDLSTALTLFREMQTEGVPFNTITYNSIIDVCIKCSDVQTAEELLREMLAPGNNLEPDLITYSTLLKGYCHCGDLDKALQVAETIKACGLKCDELVYNTLMDGCVKANDLSAGIGLFAEMTQAGMKPSSITHSILVRLYQRNDYKGNCFDAVALLYQHHGLEKPNSAMDRGGKGNNNGGSRRGDRNRTSHNQNGGRNQGQNGMQNGMDASSRSGWERSRTSASAGWDYNGSNVQQQHQQHQQQQRLQRQLQPPQHQQQFQGPSHMPPHTGGYGMGMHPQNLGMVGPDPSWQFTGRENEPDPSLSAQGSLGSVPYMPVGPFAGFRGEPSANLEVDRGMGMYQQPSFGSRGMPMAGPPGGVSWPGGPPAAYGGDRMMGFDPLQLGLGGGLDAPHGTGGGRFMDPMQHGVAGLDGHHGPVGAGHQRFAPGRMPDDGLGGIRMGGPMLDPNLSPWINNGGLPDMGFTGGFMPQGPQKAYLDRMMGMADGQLAPPLGVQCGGPPTFGEY